MQLTPFSPRLAALFAGLPLARRMALVKFGQGVAKMSGKLGGTVFAHNRGGAYARNWSVPTDPATDFQLVLRNAMRTLVVAWTEELTANEIASWETYAANVPVLNPLGDPIHLTGQQWYIACNTPRLQADPVNLPRVDLGPFNFDRGEYTAPTINSWTPATPSVDLDFTVGDPWVDEDDCGMLIFASRPQNPTINFFKGPYRLAGVILGDSITPPTSPATIGLPFTVNPGQKVFLRAAVTREDGRLSTDHRFSGIVA